MRRYLFLIISVLVVAALFLGGYFLRRWFYQPLSPGASDAGSGLLPETSNQNIPSFGNKGTSSLSFAASSIGPAEDYFVYGDDDLVFIRPDGQVFEHQGGKNLVLSSSPIEALADAGFSYDGEFLLALWRIGQSYQASVFSVREKTWRPLDYSFHSFSWAPDSQKIVFLSEKDGLTTINSLDVKNPKAKSLEIFRLAAYDLAADWASPDRIIISEKPSALVPGSVWALNTKSKALSLLVPREKGVTSAWSSFPGYGLVLRGTYYGPELSLVNETGKLLNRFTFLTNPSYKCVFSQGLLPSTSSPPGLPGETSSKIDFVTCAVPSASLPLTIESLVDDYQKKAAFSNDVFYDVNLKSGEVSILNDALLIKDATSLKIFRGKLFFVNRLDGFVYSTPLTDRN